MKGQRNLKQYIDDCECKKDEEGAKFGSFLRNMNAREEEEQMREDNPEDTVTMDIPFLTRLLELSREGVEDDDTLHRILKKIIIASTDGQTMTMDDFDGISAGVEDEEEAKGTGDDYSEADIAPASDTYSDSPVG